MTRVGTNPPPAPTPPTPPKPAPATPRPPSGPGRLVEVSTAYSVIGGTYGYEVTR